MGRILKNRHFSRIWLPWQPEMAGNVLKIQEFCAHISKQSCRKSARARKMTDGSNER